MVDISWVTAIVSAGYRAYLIGWKNRDKRFYYIKNSIISIVISILKKLLKYSTRVMSCVKMKEDSKVLKLQKEMDPRNLFGG